MSEKLKINSNIIENISDDDLQQIYHFLQLTINEILSYFHKKTKNQIYILLPASYYEIYYRHLNLDYPNLDIPKVEISKVRSIDYSYNVLILPHYKFDEILAYHSSKIDFDNKPMIIKTKPIL